MIDKAEGTELNESLILNLRDLGHKLRFLFEGKGSQKRILIILYENGEMTQRALTDKIGIQPGSASEVIKKLDDAGLIMRTANEQDRRTVDIRLTQEGRNLAEEAYFDRKKRHEEMFSCLSAEEKVDLISMIQRLNEDWEIRYQKGEACSAEHHGEHGDSCDHRAHHRHHRGKGRQ